MIHRRLLVLTTGVAATLTGSALAAAEPSSEAGRAEQTPTEAAALRANCERYGGISKTWTKGYGPEGEWYCDLPAETRQRLQAQCDAQFPAEDQIIASFDMTAGRCRHIDVGCFLTTACAELIGLEDDCFELRTLRWFRDEKLAKMPDGQRDIALYYQTAPEVLRRIGHGLPARRQLSAIYAGIIVPSVICIKLRQYGLARAIYTRGMQRLVRAYIG